MPRAIIDFNPEYLHRFCGADFGLRYHIDPLYREEQDGAVAAALRQRFPEYPSLFPAPEERVEIGWGLQPLDFLNAARGARMAYASDAAIQSIDRSLAQLNCPAAIMAEPDIDWDQNPVWRDLLRQIGQLRCRYPGRKVTWVQSMVIPDRSARRGGLSLHSPYTTAFRLLGEDIFLLMYEEPETAEMLFDYIYRQYRRSFERAAVLFDCRLDYIHFGDCAATMLSPELFARYNLKFMQRCAAADRVAIHWHSCGPSTHLLPLAAEIPNLRRAELGAHTDLKLARRFLPQAEILAYYSAGELLNQTPDEVERHFQTMCEALEDRFIICASSVDSATDPASLDRYLALAEKLNRSFRAA